MFANRVLRTRLNRRTNRSKRFNTSRAAKKNQKRMMIAGGVAVVSVATYFFSDMMITRQLKSTSAFKASLNIVKESPQIKELIGDNIRDGYKAHSKRNSKHFFVSFEIVGDKGRATVESITYSGITEFEISDLIVKKDDQVIHLL
eukprot:TRINITY_DN4594_c0_g1_i2.p1 TRINITY_DN4594_c0_g1~~TRINITY_DN4594_c0_g1_i2.p1  ORF type:complete len:145 (-),score=20.40 TRINITY_DN4594_c0_g1_i2:32-466(-)